MAQRDGVGSNEESNKWSAEQWLEVFRAGDYGDKGTYTEADLQHVVDSYDPGFHEAPAVIGHPEHDAPAYGWVAGLKRVGAVLLAKLSQVSPKLEEMVKSGAFKKRSVSFYRKPEGLQLRHIGFLGAKPPEVKGLAEIRFEEDIEATGVAFWEDSVTNNIDGSNGSWLPLVVTGTHGEKELTRSDLDAIANNFANSRKKIPLQFGRPAAKGPALANIDSLKRDGNTLKGRLADADPRLSHLLTAGKLKTCAADISGHGTTSGPTLDAIGLVQPAHLGSTWRPTEGALDAMAKSAVSVQADTDFTEGGNARLQRDVNSQELSTLAKVRAEEQRISFCEALSQVANERPDLTRPRQNALAVDVNGRKLTTLAKDRAKEQSISFGEALSQVASERPELTIPHFEFQERR